MDEFFYGLAIGAAGLFALTAINLDMPIEKATLAQEVCIKANSKVVSFDRGEVTCENKAVIPLYGG